MGPLLGAPELLARLPQEEQILITLHYVKGRSPEEIAALLGVPARSVEVILRQGRARLLGFLGISEAL
ncbi:MAG: sigma-70 family RNA polymerase sigma factor [Actinobacteria bacterium]|nr:sigma-70 family RNA polymerase sigma factor [Actinomycetota bacterium]MSY51806.1 sigma-70 family RNA polymerase sigma factor [Actinomycetota bacterium]MSY87401.1 sigma-70 family RNA polymerase sigma factor [Actinomycetota bacterium]MTA51120.1 sigma-70 family RNA polymerase sigma factor [Actinomycetota bacterium]